MQLAIGSTGKVQRLQSALYVRCSTDLRERTSKDKFHSRGSLFNVYKPPCPAFNVLSALDPSVELSVQVVVRTCAKDSISSSRASYHHLRMLLRLSAWIRCCRGRRDPVSEARRHFAHFTDVCQTALWSPGDGEPEFGVYHRRDQQTCGIPETLDYVDNKTEGLIKEADSLIVNGSDYQGDTFQSLEKAMIVKKEEMQEQIEKLDRRREQKELLVKLTQLRFSQKSVNDTE
ncbi:hypothetical protein FPCIR_14281 [Fusarium pseudocircinatum]|uniref:Uncharacterized protein n=1 Tax=Fusarium pseudocircinatum TaxID=56676 RepID=A0A8H5NNT9_9HYPO|nr:hypothetical protein FPCIR_14281 [Fusarium pseudocircinatum]